MLLLGLLALGRATCSSIPPPDPSGLGEPVDLSLPALSGPSFRLLPGVGPVLAGRLEAARQARGGRLEPVDLHAVPGVGPSLRRRWETLWSR